MVSNGSVSKNSVVIVGGGAGGLSVASCLLNHVASLDVTVVEPSEFHYYQPAWTLVGGGSYNAADTRRAEADVMPHQVKWVRSRVAAFEPENDSVVLADGSRLRYEYLVVAAGIQLDWGKIDGLEQTLGRNGVTSNYRFDLAPYTWECIRGLQSGQALFTQPAMPIKCAGAPQKILYLAADYLRRRGIQVDMRFFTPGTAMFGVPFYSAALDQVMKHYGAHAEYGHNLVAVDGPRKKATFEVGPEKRKVHFDFEMIHVVPPQSAPDVVKESALADSAGWLDVDKTTLRHVRYPNVFGLGDCTSTPNSKTAAAVRAQTPVVVANLIAAIDGQPLSAAYDGYCGCPLPTSRGKVLLAEFAYDGVITPSFPLDPRVPRRSYWWLKKTYMPWLYWRMLGGDLGPDWHAKRRFKEPLPAINP